MNRGKKPLKYKKYKRRSGGVTFIALFFIILILVLGAVFFYNNDEKTYPRPDLYLVSYYCDKYDVETNLVYAVMKQESGFNPDAISSKGAVGLMQVMPDTASWAASKIGLDYDEAKLKDESYNLHIAIWFLSYLTKEYEGNTTKVIAAYNGGDGNVNYWLKEGIWDGTLNDADSIPFAETGHYVETVSRNLEKYREIYR